MKCHVMQRICASRYQQCTPVCLFGGKGDSKNGDEGSPWKSIEKAMSNFKKEKSLEDVLRQQIEKKDYYDGGSGDLPPGGGGGGGGDGFGEPEDEGFAGILDDILQVTLAILALVALYLYIIAGDQVMLFLTDAFDFLSGKKGPRLRAIMYDIGKLYQTLNTRTPYDPYWLEKAIITTPTLYDTPKKYERILKTLKRASKGDMDSDSDDDDEKVTSDNTNTNDDDDESDNYNANDEDSDNEIVYPNKTYNDDDGYNEDIDDDF